MANDRPSCDLPVGRMAAVLKPGGVKKIVVKTLKSELFSVRSNGCHAFHVLAVRRRSLSTSSLLCWMPDLTHAENDTAATAEDPLERSWPALQGFLSAVHGTSSYSQHSFQELYSAVEALVLAKQGAKLYDRLHAACEAHISSLVSSFAGVSRSPQALLEAVQSTWSAHCSQMVMVRNVFLYLDRTYVRDTPGTRSLW